MMMTIAMTTITTTMMTMVMVGVSLGSTGDLFESLSGVSMLGCFVALVEVRVVAFVSQVIMKVSFTSTERN